MKEVIEEKIISKIKIDHTSKGFTIWFNEGKGIYHWILDGSLFLETGEINLGQKLYKHEMEYDKKTNSLKLICQKK